MKQGCVSPQKFIFCVLLMVLAVQLAWSQASTATASGTVRDESSAVVPGAAVTITNTATNIVLKTNTNDTGFYMFPGIVPGPYQLTVEMSGMQKFQASLTVQVQQSAVVDVTLKVGQTSTKVFVADVTPLVQTDNPTLGGTLERSRIEQLPINGRNVTNLLTTVPGMEDMRAHGMRGGSFEAVLDGAPLADRNAFGSDVSAKGQITLRQPGLDSIQEFAVQNNASSARFSRPTNIVLTTKGGTNDLHGSAFETNRNNGYGVARRRQDGNATPAPLNRNEFGVSAGGPVYIPKLYNGKNKTFWFFSYEGLRNIQSTTQSFRVPTQAMRGGDMSALVDPNNIENQSVLYDPLSTNSTTWTRQPFPNNQIPASAPYQNALAQRLFNATPLPTESTVNPQLDNNWIGPVANPTRSWTVSSRIDHHFGERDQIYGRYTQGGYSSSGYINAVPSKDPKLPFNTNLQTAPNKSAAISYVHTFSPTLFNELLVSGTRQPQWNGTGEPGVYYADDMGLQNMFHVPAWPLFTSTGLGGNYGLTSQNTNAFFSWNTILDDNFTKIYGKHELQFGFHFRNDQMNMLPEQQIGAGQLNFASLATALYDSSAGAANPKAVVNTGDNLANFYMGVASYEVNLTRSYFYLRQKEMAGYLQDNFRVTPRLTVNLGLRYEYNAPMREKNGMLTSFDVANHAVVLDAPLSKMYALNYTDPSLVNALQNIGVKFEQAGQGNDLPSGLLRASKTDLGPRLGFAYRALDGKKSFVVRGGYSVSYFHLPLFMYGARMRKNSPLFSVFKESLTDSVYTPDHLANYGLRSVPTVFAGTPSDLNVIPRDASQAIGANSGLASAFGSSQPSARVQNWNLTLEKSVTANTVARAAFIGNHSSNIEALNSLNAETPEYLWMRRTGTQVPDGDAYGNVYTYDHFAYDRVEEWTTWGKGNSTGFQLELQRRLAKGYGYQLYYVMDNNFASGGQGYNQLINPVGLYADGSVPLDAQTRNDVLNYRRDTAVPKHRVRWNWAVELPFGKGKPIFGNANRLLDALVGGWQVTGMGSLRSNYFQLPTSNAMFPTGNPVETYGYKYPIQNCTSGKCIPGYLWWNGYISPELINRTDANGKPTGIMGVPDNYKPAVTWLVPRGQTGTAPDGKPWSKYWNTNTAFVPLTDGTVARTTWSGLTPLNNQFFPSTLQWGLDASASKNFAITERIKVRFQADAFNVLNHPGNTATVGSNGVLSTQNSGQDPRTIQLSLRTSW